MGQSNVDSPSNQIAVGFGNVVKARVIYSVPGTTEINNQLANPIGGAIALLDVLNYSGAEQTKDETNVSVPVDFRQTVDKAPAGAVTAVGLAASEAVVNNTGIYGYKLQSGDQIALYKKGKFYLVNVDGVVAFKDKLIPSQNVAGAVQTRTGGIQPIGFATAGNNGVAGGPIIAWIDTTVSEQIISA